MRFDFLIPTLLLTTCTLALGCSDDGKSEVGDDTETGNEGDGDGDSSESGSEGSEASTDAESSTDAETTDVGTSDAETDVGTTDAETTDAETTDAETTDVGTTTAETGTLSCSEIEAEYDSLVTMTDCQGDDECKIISGHCGVGLGGCDYAVNVGVSETALDELAEAYVAGNCTNGVCDCAPPPASAICDNGTCVGVG